tara:strand:- start:284 stop:2851 length:2568 start_codon:yes stop_codon:yes gene_type:complete
MIIPLLTFLGIGTTTASIIASVLTVATLAVGIKGFLQVRDMLQEGQTILAQKTSAGGKIPVIYGSRRIGSQVVFMDTADNNSKHLFVVYALSVGEIENIDGRSIELDGASITDSARFRDGGYIGSDKISSGNGSLNTADQTGDSPDIEELTAGTLGTDPTDKYRFVLNLHHGAASQTVDPMLNASISSKFTTAHKLNGIAYIAATFKFDHKGKIWRGVPQLTVEVQGKKVFDPRDSSQTFGTVSTYKWSDNPALALLDYMTNNEYGKGLGIAQINTSKFETAANLADGTRSNPDFNGSYRQIAWSGQSGFNFAYITDFDEWKKFKVGEYLTLKDNSGSTVVDNRLITGKNTYRFFGSTRINIIRWDSQYPLGANYTVTATSNTVLTNAKRFQCNAYIDTNANVIDNAKALLANMRGYLNYIQGKYELEIEDTGSSTFTITESHIISDAGINVDYGSKDDKANVVIVEFFNGAKDYELDTATVYHSATTDVNDYTSDDGNEVLEIKAQFPYITDYYVAYNMAKTILTRSRYQTRVQFVGTSEMYKLNVNDIVSINYSPLGFSSKVFRVEALELMSNGQLQVSLLEYFDVYTWTIPPTEKVGDPIDVPQSYVVEAPTNVTFTDTGSSATGRAIVSWTNPTNTPIKEFRADVFDSSNNQILSKIVDSNVVDLSLLPKGSNYVAKISTINSNDVESSTADLTFTIADEPIQASEVKIGTNPLDNVLGTSGTGATANLTLGADSKNQLLVNGIQLQYTAYDQVQANGDLVLDFDQSSATFYPETTQAGFRETVISRSDTSLTTYKISLDHKQGLIVGGAAGSAPSSATDTGTTGTITWDSNYIYVCVATNTWKRVAISTW